MGPPDRRASEGGGPQGAAVKENGINSAGKAHKKKIKGRERLGLTWWEIIPEVVSMVCLPCAPHGDPIGAPQDKTRGR